MQWFWKLLEKAGLCKAFVDPYGRVIVLRYHLFGIEPDEMDVDEVCQTTLAAKHLAAPHSITRARTRRR